MTGPDAPGPDKGERDPAGFWNERFARPGYLYGLEPNAFLKRWMAGIDGPKSILLPADGDGRNAVWLAGLGHAVTSVDVSDVALEKARALASNNGVIIETIHADLTNWSPPEAAFDIIALTFLHLRMPMRRTVHRALAASLKPGGMLMLQAFSVDQLGFTSGGPKLEALLYRIDDVVEDFAGLEIIHRAEQEVDLDEGPLHSGRAAVVELVARRPE